VGLYVLASHSDEEGIYMIQGLRPGRYRAELSVDAALRAPGQPSLHLEEEVEVSGPTQHDFEFQSAHA